MMEQELFRLATFSNWSDNLLVRPPRLARNGFYYSGEGNRVTCHKCGNSGIHIDDCTSSDSVVEQHKNQSPDCPLLADTSVQNIPLLPVPIGDRGATETDHAAKNCCEKIQEIYRGAVSRATKRGIFSTNPVKKIDRSHPDYYDLMRHEKHRISTFDDWLSGAQADPKVLAREGLLYTGEADRVQCVFCRGFMRNWEATDIPSVEHKKHFPDCPFVRGLDVGNVSMTGEGLISDHSRKTSDVERQQPAQNAQSLRTECPQPTVIEQIRYVAPSSCDDPPKFPEFSDMTRRIASFKNGQVSHGHTAEALAEAGWFFIGPGDKVQCFQCGGNLRDWQQEDDPFDEHKRWYSNCSYIKSLQQAMMTRRQLQGQTIPTNVMTSATQYRVEPREIKARMDTAKVRAILDMGYPRGLVRRAIEERLSTTGDDFPNAENLLEELFRLEATNPMASASGLTASSAASDGAGQISLMPTTSPSPTSSSSSNTTSTTSPRSTPPYNGLHTFADSHSLPFINQTYSSASLSMSTFQSLAVGLSEHPSASAVVSVANHLETIAEAQSKAKGKRKRSKKKPKATGASNAATNDEDEQVAESAAGPQTGLGILAQLEEMNLNENQDEETLQYVEENRRLREARSCKVCMDAEVNTVFLPCGHLVCCNSCAPALRNCPICRTFIRGTVKTFLS